MHYNESINHQLNVIFKVKKRLAHILHYGKAWENNKIIFN